MSNLRRWNPKQLTFPWYREPIRPHQIRQLPPMTDLEFFWGSPEQIDDDRYWFRAFRALPGRPYQNFFHLYTWKPFRTATDLKRLLADCVKDSFQTKTHGDHGKIIIQCCPDRYWDPKEKRCIESRPRYGKRPLFYKVLIPDYDLQRLLDLGLARIAEKRIRGIPVTQQYFEDGSNR